MDDMRLTNSGHVPNRDWCTIGNRWLSAPSKISASQLEGDGDMSSPRDDHQ
jgi:hypothetical protein